MDEHNDDDDEDDEYFELFDEIGKEKERRAERNAYISDRKEAKEREKNTKIEFNGDSEITGSGGREDNASQIQRFVAGMNGNSKGQERVSSLNDSQEDALIVCLNDIERKNEKNGSVSLVQGPPGCGKTHFLVALMHVLLSRGHKLIVRHYIPVIIYINMHELTMSLLYFTNILRYVHPRIRQLASFSSHF